jgi:hypothetical protein
VNLDPEYKVVAFDKSVVYSAGSAPA